MRRVTWASAGLLLLVASPMTGAEDRDSKVRGDRTKFEADDRWIYNDLDLARAEARKTGKPLLIVFR